MQDLKDIKIIKEFGFFMHTVRIPSVIKFGENALGETEYPKNALVVTTAPPKLSDKWLDKMGIQDYMLFDKVTSEPSIDDVNSLVSEFKSKKPSALIGLGGGSSMDVVKYAAQDFGVKKILIPTTFGTGAEMTTYCVLKFEGKKKLLHEDRFLADIAVVDSYFMDGTPEGILKNSVCDACAQATEGYDSKLGNDLTRTLCKQAFDVLYDAIINDKPENYPYGSMLSGIGFGNCSTTLGHALSYVFSNEGVPHGYSLSSCTTVAHKHNKSIFYEKFKQVIEKLGFDKLDLKADVSEAADTVMTDRGHLDPNPIPISKEDVMKCLEDIKSGNM
ncbi:MAG: malonic semialdehyde reductase (Iron-containing alcohol dehydrogenase) [Nitrosopumilales archaeon]|nr:MAG: malonic semialdehyde reductase (Iron-containing alcohol dehydrogenase) [Nitrosopumilales archaeon]